MPDFPVSVVTDFSAGPGLHTHFPPSAVPPAPSIGVVLDSKQSGVSVFSYLSPVTAKAGEGVSVGPGCPGGTFEVKEGMQTVLVTDIPTAFVPAATQHCKAGYTAGPAMNMILPGGMNRISVWVGGPVVGLGNANGLWGSFFKSLGLGGGGSDGSVDPAATDGSDADARSGSGGTDPNGSGNGTNPEEQQEDPTQRIYPYEALLIVDGLAWTPAPGLAVKITGGGKTDQFDFADFAREGQTGPYEEAVTNVSVTCDLEGDGVRFVAETDTVESGGGGGTPSGA